MLTRTKITVPRRRQDLLSRQRLLDILDNLIEHVLVAVVAPPGYGKTSLLIDYASKTDLPVCWYSLDHLDIDFQNYGNHFVGAIRQKFPDFGHQASSMLNSPNFNLDQFITTLVNEIFDIEEHFILVIDDYHLVEKNDDINYFMNQLVQLVSENAHLVVISRTLLPLPDIPLLIVRSQLLGVSYEELAFNHEEIQHIMLKQYGSPLSDEEAQDLINETEGWITALLLSSQFHQQHQMVDRLRVARTSGIGLYQYLVDQVLQKQPEEVRGFLLRTSVFEEFNLKFCNEMFGPGCWGERIDQISQRNLFLQTVEDDAGQTWLRYHHLFREFLQRQFKETLPEEHQQLLQKLATHYKIGKHWEQAYDAYRELEDDDHLAALVEAASLDMIETGRRTSLQNWIEQLPNELIKSNAYLLGLKGYLLEESKSWDFLKKGELLARQENNKHVLANILIWQANIKGNEANHKKLSEIVDEVIVLVDEIKDQKLRAEALRFKAQPLRYQNRITDALKYLHDALEISLEINDLQNASILQLELGVDYEQIGEYQQAEKFYRQALDLLGKTGRPRAESILLNNLGVLIHLQGDYVQAGKLLDKSLDLAKKIGWPYSEANTLASIGDLYQDLDQNIANNIFHSSQEISEMIGATSILFYTYLAIAQTTKDSNTASTYFDLAWKIIEGNDLNQFKALYSLGKGQYTLFKKNSPNQAIILLEQSLKLFQDGKQIYKTAQAVLYLACGHQLLENSSIAKTYLIQFFELITQTQTLHPVILAALKAKSFLDEWQQDPELAQKVADLREQVYKFETQIPKLRRNLRKQMSTIPFAPPSLNISAFDGARVLNNNSVVVNYTWNAYMARDLLFFVLHHPKGVTKEKIVAALWPDQEAKKQRTSFKNSIYKLRQTFGEKFIIYEEDGELYTFNDQLDFRYDVLEFLQAVKQGNDASNTDTKHEYYLQACHLYKGHYLPESDNLWVLTTREELLRAYLKAALEVSNSYFLQQEFESGDYWAKKVLKFDDCNEMAYRLLMQIYAALGNQADVVQQYQTCRNNLRQKLDVAPSTLTTALFKSLTS